MRLDVILSAAPAATHGTDYTTVLNATDVCHAQLAKVWQQVSGVHTARAQMYLVA